MLILSRKRSEQILIGDNIVITLVDVGAGRAVIGVDAPRELRVDRKEVRERIDRGEPHVSKR